ncbi:MAG: hypothetical protein OXU45_09255 [Candidatus Melainabacteria bacterium]|nr:hypothetical protein [Candidatus Melainabacteria bacterium]
MRAHAQHQGVARDRGVMMARDPHAKVHARATHDAERAAASFAGSELHRRNDNELVAGSNRSNRNIAELLAAA